MANEIDHEKRKRYIGASEISTICGLNEYQTPYGLWLIKTGRAEPSPDTPETRRGKALEAGILQMFNDESPYPDAKPWQQHKISKIDLWAACTPDAYFFEEQRRNIGVEIKSFAGYFDAESIFDKHVGAVLQCQWSMHVTRLDLWVLAWMDSGLAVQWVEIERNQDLIEVLRQTARHFWEYNVGQDIAPEPMRPSDFLKMEYLGHYAEASSFTAELVGEYREVCQSINILEAQKADLGDRLRMLIGQAEGFKNNGRKLVSWKPDKRGIRTLRTHGK